MTKKDDATCCLSGRINDLAHEWERVTRGLPEVYTVLYLDSLG